MNVVVIIPARMGSSRFPGKPLAQIAGHTMIEHVYRRSEMFEEAEAVIVATCDDEIRREVVEFGGEVMMTSSEHERATDRVAEAAAHFSVDCVVMVQGDEPLVRPSMITQAVDGIRADPDAACVNLASVIASEQEFRDPNTVKVVSDLQGRALYYSRAPIPSSNAEGWQDLRALKQVCVIPFRRDALRAYARLEPTPLERFESVDMLRFLEHGYSVKVVETDVVTHPVDVPSDVATVERLMATDDLFARYGLT